MKANQKFNYMQSSDPLTIYIQKREKIEGKKKEEKNAENEEEKAIISWKTKFVSQITFIITKYS